VVENDVQTLELTFTSEQSLGEKAASGQVIEVLGPHGEPVAEPVEPAVLDVEPKKPMTTTLTTPSNLPDGYYRIVASAAASTGESPVTATSVQYVRVHDGETDVVTGDEFEEHSGALTAIED
jgi:hypothetical protein